jgi:hypothetical protein
MELDKFNTANFRKLHDKKAEYTNTHLSNSEGYEYISKLLMHPVRDGRHRILWLIVAPFAANILRLTREEAFTLVESYMALCNKAESTDAGNQIAYHLDRAKMESLYPPKLETIKNSDPDLYEIIVNAIESI